MNRRCSAVVFLLAALLPVSAEADTRDDVMAGMARCAPITDNRAWLDCLYGAAQPMRALLGLSPAPQARGPSVAVRPNPAPVQSAPVQPAPQFGMAVPVPAAQGVTARMTSYTFDTRHYFTVVLEGGQTWSQVKGDTSIADWTRPAASYVAKISRGALGSFNLNVVGRPGGYKVTRIN